MINLSDIGGLYLSLPANLKDARTKAFMYACDRQIEKLLQYTEKVKVWCAIEAVDEKHLDFIAEECRALFYSTELDPEKKRQLIINTQYWYMKLGTLSAIKEMVDIVFPGAENAVTEWHEYGGEPYHFKVSADADSSQEGIEEFRRMIEKVKNARSLFDGLEFRRELIQKIYSVGSCMMEKRMHIDIDWEEEYGDIQ